MDYKIYCDESCHLEKDGSNVMVIGAVWCPHSGVKEINRRIRQIKARNCFSETAEIKWTKVGPAKIQLYKDLINYFFDEKALNFRAVVIPDKAKLDHDQFNQMHHLWYYKMYFTMLKTIFQPRNGYEIYIDIKDTHSNKKIQELQEVCRNAARDYDFNSRKIKKMQPIRSEEVEIIQLTDLLIGALCYNNRDFPKSHKKSEAKLDLIDLMKDRSGCSLEKSTLLREEKVNLLFWEAR